MPMVLPTIQEYVATERKKDTLFIRFHRGLNNMMIPEEKRDLDINDIDLWDDSLLNESAREDFIAFMKKHFPHTKLVNVFDDNIPRYFGTIAIDTELGDDCYQAIVERYEDTNGDPLSNDAVLWILSYEIAQKAYKEKNDMWEDEY